MNRRSLLKSLIATTLTSSLPLSSMLAINAQASTSTKSFPWKNWSGNQKCVPSERLAPASIAELQTLIRQKQPGIRALGSGHSFSALVPTNDILLSTRRLSGLKSIDKEKQQATFYSGTLLSECGPILNENHQALINMPDIDQQTLAGAISTATHGTGMSLGSLSSYVIGLEMVSPQGDLVQCSNEHNPELFRAAQVGLGSLGIITSITMQNQAPFNLIREAQWMSFEDVTEQAHKLAKDNRNFEFFYFPFTGMALTDTLNITNEPPSSSEEIDGNSGIMDLKAARDYLGWSSQLRELIIGTYMKTLETHTNIDHSYAIYANDRNVRFNEMEYHLPVEEGIKALGEVRDTIEKHFSEAFFPIECRFIKGEEAWLSPFYQRDSISIAVHRYFEEDYQPMFKAIEPIFRKYGGRPHWGKLNTFSREEFKKSYPKWNDFIELRRSFDPESKFLNTYLKDTIA
ncbi:MULTISPECIES: D-arabinono-1,4-lactone oxidase [unclassified Oleiphilus]|uniref:D-arabinono-1,4-lactone oxidase n=2 Tax=Oleiphilus TaxID=141450 RepID=UPI0007C31388|nr:MULTISPECIES: D-arabinono-1,4-lactone oxidase [unclassified Oleiphilus]KZY46076.1 FAD-binding protein [Oleiphilus sp. HI0050]KZY72657.1 FAD-binding protein [Oleiphilus sp. HI0068]KZY76576.1 FAD-binding protein [Oleiphilus sp. HI0069]KZY88799.1 FAD-binding protein [Oleiphilus sp. HI0072]KZZ20478.1 FAD-binding protein [Oleiphilus sp. HI0081]